jgi:hypothetical protein
MLASRTGAVARLGPSLGLKKMRLAQEDSSGGRAEGAPFSLEKKMAEVVEIPYRKIRGTKEWQAQQDKLREAFEVIQQSLEESGALGMTIDNGQTTDGGPESRFLARHGGLGMASPEDFLVLARRWRLARLLEERGQIARAMCQEVRADGRRCRYPAEEGGQSCRAHAEWKVSPLASLPFPDDALGLQRLMAKLLQGLMYEGMDPLKARVAADVCRTMRANLGACAEEAARAEEEMYL